MVLWVDRLHEAIEIDFFLIGHAVESASVVGNPDAIGGEIPFPEGEASGGSGHGEPPLTGLQFTGKAGGAEDVAA